jgi:metal-responsive CopG/Arc/MetJ family transcriptional regulator
MNTAVLIPDDLFQRAEQAASQLQISRSDLYSKAIAEFLDRQDGDALTKRLNQIYTQEDSLVEPSLQAAQLRLLEKEP